MLIGNTIAIGHGKKPLRYHLDKVGNSFAAYSLRKLRKKYTGAAIRVRRSSDSVEQDIGFVGQDLDTATLLSFVGSGDGFVTKWYDQSGSGNDAVQANTAYQPKIILAGVLYTLNNKPSILFTNSPYFTIAYAVNQRMTSKVSISSVFQPIIDWGGNGTGYIIDKNNGEYALCVYQTGSTFSMPLAGAFNVASSTAIYLAVAYHALTTFDSTLASDNVKFFLNNVLTGTINKATAISPSSLGMALGVNYGTSRKFRGYISEVIIRNIDVSIQRDIIQNDVGKYYTFAPRTVNVICDGNSLTIGNGVATKDNYPSQLSLVCPQCQVLNLGVSGQTTPMMSSDAATQVDVTYKSSLLPNIVICWEGTNDLCNGASAATAYANIVSYCQARKAAGHKVIVGTILPRSNNTPGSFETSRQTINSQIRENYLSFADAVMDVGGDPVIGAAGSQNNTTYYQSDTTHLTQQGYVIVANTAKNAILSVL